MLSTNNWTHIKKHIHLCNCFICTRTSRRWGCNVYRKVPYKWRTYANQIEAIFSVGRHCKKCIQYMYSNFIFIIIFELTSYYPYRNVSIYSLRVLHNKCEYIYIYIYIYISTVMLIVLCCGLFRSHLPGKCWRTTLLFSLHPQRYQVCQVYNIERKEAMVFHDRKLR